MVIRADVREKSGERDKEELLKRLLKPVERHSFAA
jgi:hypothetical protein